MPLAMPMNTASTARLAAGFGLAKAVAFNRRFRMKSGLSVTHPGPEIPTSSSRPARSIRRSACSALGMLKESCWAASSTSPVMPRPAPGGMSADYVGYIEKTIRGLMGEKCT